jgi:hypothetical protein
MSMHDFPHLRYTPGKRKDGEVVRKEYLKWRERNALPGLRLWSWRLLWCGSPLSR